MVVMAGQNIIFKNLAAFKGLDLRTSDILREKDKATDMNNVEFRQTGSLNKRKGYQFNSLKSIGGYGQTTFKDISTTTGAVTEQLISIDDNLTKMVNNSFNITYSGASNAFYETYVKEAVGGNTIYFKVIEAGLTILDTDLGVGNETTPTDITALVALVNALTDFTSGTITGAATTPAAFIPITAGQTAITNSTIIFSDLADVATPTGYTTPFSTFLTKITDADFENASFAQINEILYIATGYEELHKYDGTRVYRAGMPQATTPTAATAGSDAGSFTNNRIVRYKVTAQHTDAKGNVIEGVISSHVIETASGTGEAINVTYTELAGSAGWDVDGTLVYNIWRTDDSADATDASLYYLIRTAAHGDTIPYKDTGIVEGAEFIVPIRAPQLPPKTRYCDTWRGQLILSGDILNVDTTYYSDVASPEYFPAASNSFIVDNKITGIKALDNTLYVFEENAINAITGDLAADNFQVDPASRSGVGCLAHHTIVEVLGSLFFLSDRGIYSINAASGSPEFVGEPVSPKFSKLNPFTFKQAVAYNWRASDKYIIYMPVLPTDPSYSIDTTSEVYVFDYFRSSWLKWTQFNFLGGISELNGDLYFSKRVTGARHVCRVLQTGTTFDYADHTESIVWSYKANWETLNEPSQWKKFLRIKMHSYDVTINDFESQIFSVVVKQEIDWNSGKTTLVGTLDFSGGVLGWGLDPWGQFPWGMARLKQLKRKLMSKKAKSIRMIFENSNIHENVLISGYELQAAASYRNMMHE
jgi:hypothetical protein